MSWNPHDYDGITNGVNEERDYHERMERIAEARDAARTRSARRKRSNARQTTRRTWPRSATAWGSTDRPGFEIVRHDFRLTPDAQEVIAAKKKGLREDWERVERAVHRLNRAGNLNYTELSIAAKAYFLLDQRGKPAGAGDLVRLAHQFGWTVTEQEVEKAVEFLGGLELATVAA